MNDPESTHKGGPGLDSTTFSTMSARFRNDVKALYGFDHVLKPESTLRSGDMFGPAKRPVAGADAQTNLLNFLGRVV